MQRRYHYERKAHLARQIAAVFAQLDDLAALARHMSERSAAMLGSRLTFTTLQTAGGVGNRYRWKGHIPGIPIDAVEEVAIYEPPRRKRWCTIGTPRLVVIAPLRALVYRSNGLGYCGVTGRTRTPSFASAQSNVGAAYRFERPATYIC